MAKPEIQVFASHEQLIHDVSLWLQDLAQSASRDHDLFSCAISGGTTPRDLYAYLGEHPELMPWDHTRLYVVDERDVYPSDPLSNAHMIQSTLLHRIATRPHRYFPWHTVAQTPESLSSYRQALDLLPKEQGFPQLDLAMQGMGADGHTASVFPDSPQIQSRDWVAYGPGAQVPRYTLTLPLLSHARQVAFLVTGEAKAQAVKTCLTKTDSPLPAAWLSAHAEHVVWFLDQDSAALL